MPIFQHSKSDISRSLSASSLATPISKNPIQFSGSKKQGNGNVSSPRPRNKSQNIGKERPASPKTKGNPKNESKSRSESVIERLGNLDSDENLIIREVKQLIRNVRVTEGADAAIKRENAALKKELASVLGDLEATNSKKAKTQKDLERIYSQHEELLNLASKIQLMAMKIIKLRPSSQKAQKDRAELEASFRKMVRFENSKRGKNQKDCFVMEVIGSASAKKFALSKKYFN